MCLWVNRQRCTEGIIFSDILVGLHIHYWHIMETSGGTTFFCGENSWRNKAPVCTRSERKKKNISDPLSSHLRQYCGGLQKE